MGEYWVAPSRNGEKVVPVGKLDTILISLITEQTYEEGVDNTP